MTIKKESAAPTINEQPKKMTVLVKDANTAALKRYFAKVLKLSFKGNPYPVNLDEVWPLVYASKQKATDVLEKEFFEGEDFLLNQKGKQDDTNLLNQKGKQDWGGHNVTTYKLSLSCMEYLIVRKARAVFEVYRTYFHSANTPINGVMPMLCNGILGYPRKELLISCGRSYKNGYRLRYKYADDCFNIGRTACVSFHLGTLLQQQYNVRQLELNFSQKGGDYAA